MNSNKDEPRVDLWWVVCCRTWAVKTTTATAARSCYRWVCCSEAQTGPNVGLNLKFASYDLVSWSSICPKCPPHAAVLQVSGAGAAVQLRAAGYAPTEEANVQRTLSLQAHPVTYALSPAFKSTCSSNQLVLDVGTSTLYRDDNRSRYWLGGKNKSTFLCHYPEKGLLLLTSVQFASPFSAF